ncbi:hypothetical protein CUR86_06875 [Salinicola acroporae]|uniref:Uncharacterized protein n=1 Tax=Salinicola acroporae TaxID=1541440 RepID=A0ABT6I3W3_9GAMM|nr:hypothetical protein [Salinicola acroporae]
MQDTIINAHRLIGETIQEPGEPRRGRIVGVDQSRPVPVIFVIWQEQSGIHRFELTRDELSQLASACQRRQSGWSSKPEADTRDDGKRRSEESSTFDSHASPRRRVGSR